MAEYSIFSSNGDFISNIDVPTIEDAHLNLLEGQILKEGHHYPMPSLDVTVEGQNKIIRNNLLSSTDWTQLNDAPLTPEEIKKYRVYRDKLRNLNLKDPNLVWPEIN